MQSPHERGACARPQGSVALTRFEIWEDCNEGALFGAAAATTVIALAIVVPVSHPAV